MISTMTPCLIQRLVYKKRRKMSARKNFTDDEARPIGEQLDVDWKKIDFNEFKMGLSVELEHGLRDAKTNVTDNDLETTAKIALAHLNEYPDYYTRLEKLEEEAEEYWSTH